MTRQPFILRNPSIMVVLAGCTAQTPATDASASPSVTSATSTPSPATSERAPFDRANLERMMDLAQHGIGHRVVRSGAAAVDPPGNGSRREGGRLSCRQSIVATSSRTSGGPPGFTLPW